MTDFLEITATFTSTVTAALVVLVTLVAAIYGFAVFIDSRVTKRLRDRETLESLVALMRPSVIFTANAVLADLGAMSAIQSILVEPTSNEDPTPKTITVEFNRFIKLEPLLQCLDPIFYNIEANRTGKFSWQYQLNEGAAIGGITSPRFRLEIL